MNAYAEVQPKHKQWLKNSLLILFAFATAFFPRIIQSVGVPAVINFVHFATVPLAFGIVLTTTKTKDKGQIATSWAIVTGLFILLTAMTASTLLNRAGLVNLALGYLFFAEPFMILLAVISIPLSPVNFKKFRFWILSFAWSNLLIAIAQSLFIKIGLLRVTQMTPEDNVQGVFYLSGAGNYVSATVSLGFALYYFASAKKSPIWLKIFILLAALYQLFASDSKQVLFTFFAAWVLLVLTKVKELNKLLIYVIGIIITLWIFLWAVKNLDIVGFDAFKYWINRTDIYGSNGEAERIKLAGVRYIISSYNSSLNWLFGLGPGHTIGRLGGWVIREYESMLIPLGVTTHPASEQAVQVLRGSWLALSSSFFSPLFSWGGIWGDFGLVGLGSYVYLGLIVWTRLCVNDFSKLLMFTVVIVGFILTQMEEPGYMLSVAILIGLQWQEKRINSAKHHRSIISNTDVISSYAK
jgi:hypothetical protein